MSRQAVRGTESEIAESLETGMCLGMGLWIISITLSTQVGVLSYRR